jgi:hypothetical protein
VANVLGKIANGTTSVRDAKQVYLRSAVYIMRSDRERFGFSRQQVFGRAVSPPKDRLDSVFTKKEHHNNK